MIGMHRNFWPTPLHSNKRYRVDWRGVFFLALLAIAIGMALGWLYTIVFERSGRQGDAVLAP
jgi:hypothetical protein